MKTVIFEPDRLIQIRQITEVAELADIHIVPLSHLWGGQVRMNIAWKIAEPITFAAQAGMSPLSLVCNPTDTFSLNFDFAPLHIVKIMLEEYSDKCRFDSAHEKAEVVRVYGTAMEV